MAWAIFCTPKTPANAMQTILKPASQPASSRQCYISKHRLDKDERETPPKPPRLHPPMFLQQSSGW